MFPTNLSVLIVDDSFVARQILIGYLKELGFTYFLEAQNGDEALKMLKVEGAQGKIGLIISDLQMPIMPGHAFIEAVRNEERFNNIPFLVASIESNRATILNVVAKGSTNYLLKPVTLENLKRKLEFVFGHKAS